MNFNEKLQELIDQCYPGNSWQGNAAINLLLEASSNRAKIEALDGTSLTAQNKELRKIVDHLSERDKRYSEIIESANDLIYEIDHEGTISYVNERITHVLGYSRNEFVGKKFWIFCRTDKMNQVKKIYLELVAKGQLESYLEIPILSKSTDTIWFGQNVSFFYKGDTFMKANVVARDVTRRKLNEERILQLSQFQHSILSSTDLAIVTINREGKITSFNKGGEAMLGYSMHELVNVHSPLVLHSKKQLIERSIELTKQYKIKIQHPIEIFTYEIVKGKKEFDTREWVFLRKNGEEILVELTMSPLKDSANEINGFLTVAKDITSRKMAEDELLKAKVLAEKASNAKNEFLANMSHEIRTPLNAIIGYTELLVGSKLDEIQRQYMQFVHQSSHVLLDTVNDILDFSKIEAGKLELAEDEVDLHELCGKAIDMIRIQAAKKKIELLLSIAKEVKEVVWADSHRLSQILVNLLGNAVKFTQEGEIELKVEAITTDADGLEMFRFSVRDTGVGIAKKNQSKIFKVFEQEDLSTTKKFGGSGLGLSIANSLLKLMNSELQLVSEAGEGATFYCDVAFKTKGEYKQQLGEMPPIQSLLIIDNNASSRAVVREMFQDTSVRIDEAESGLQAVEMIILGKQEYDLILVDQHMPFMNGFATKQQIAERYQGAKPLKFILMSSSIENETLRKELRRFDIGHFVKKPIKQKQLTKVLNEVFLDACQVDFRDVLQQKKESQNEAIENPKNPVILIAEDNAINMLLAKAMVKSILPLANIIQAKNGKEALDLFKKEQPDLILMDIQMPELNGIEATKKIRAKGGRGHGVKIIALTAGIMPSEKAQCFDAGMNDYISKPFAKKTLEEVIAKWL